MNKKMLIVCLALAAAGTGGWRQFEANATRAALEEIRAKLATAEAQIEDSTQRLEVLEAERQSQKREGTRIAASIAKAQQELQEQFPETRWATPPDVLPQWDPRSPFVWISKDIAPRLHLAPFTTNGELDPGVLSVLAVDKAGGERLNERLKEFLRHRKQLEFALAKRSGDHLPGATGQSGEKLTIVVPPDTTQSEQLEREFHSILQTGLGPQRAEMILRAAEHWIAANLSEFGKEPKTISLVRLPDGRFGVSRRSGSDWQSLTGDADSVKAHIPNHLLPFFAELFEPRAPTHVLSSE